MNRTQRAKIKAAHEKLNMDRAFKNDALYSMKNDTSFHTDKSRFERENEVFEASRKALRRLKKYNGPTGSMSEENYMELMGA